MQRLQHNVNVAKNRALPRFDLTGSYQFGGVSGTSTITDEDGNTVTIRDGLGDAARQVFNFDFPGWAVGLQYSVPIAWGESKCSTDQES